MTRGAAQRSDAHASTGVDPVTEAGGERGRWWAARRIVDRYPVLQLGALVAIALWAVGTIPALTNPVSMVSVLVLAALLGLAAMGQTLVVILGGLDLAVPGYIATGAFTASALAGGMRMPLLEAAGLTVLICGAVGALTGLICARFAVQPLVVTLGTGAILSGGVVFAANGSFVAAPPDGLRYLAGVTSTTFGFPLPPVVVIWIVAAIAVGIFLARTPAGRRLYATGANPRAAALSRIRTLPVWIGAFTASGVLAGLAGMLMAGFAGGSTATIGDPYLFTGLAAVLVGGTTFGSVNGDYTRTVLGALILTLLSTVLVGQGFSEGQSRILYGVILLVVVGVYGRERRLRDRV